MRQDFVDKVMSVDCVLHVFDMSELAINITKGEKIANSEFTKTRTACTVMYCSFFIIVHNANASL